MHYLLAGNIHFFVPDKCRQFVRCKILCNVHCTMRKYHGEIPQGAELMSENAPLVP